MKIKLRFFSFPDSPTSNQTLAHEIAQGQCVSDLLDEFGIVAEDRDLNILINGHRAGKHSRLEEGDSVVIFPLIEGG